MAVSAQWRTRHPTGTPPSRVLGGGLGYGRRYGDWVRVRAREQGRLLRSVDGEGDHLVDSIDAGSEHDEPIDPDGDSGAGGQTVIHGGEQAVVHGNFREFSVLSGRQIGLEPMALLGRVGEFVVTVGELDPVDPGFESLGHGGCSGSDLRERSLRSRVVVDKGRPPSAELRLDHVTHEQVEPGVAVVTEIRWTMREKVRSPCRQNLYPGGVGINSHVTLKRLRISELFRSRSSHAMEGDARHPSLR